MDTDGVEYGSIPRRLVAAVVDLLVATVLSIPVAVLIAVALFGVNALASSGLALSESDREAQAGLAVAAGFGLGLHLGLVLYDWISTALGGGWGKRLLGLRVVLDADGRAPGFSTAAGRATLKWVLTVPGGILGVLNVGLAIFDKRRQTLHDRAAGTLVVRHRG